jgi:protein-tyrosine phosphatase
LVAAGYGFIGPGIFRKDHGVLPWTTWLLLGPILVGQRLSMCYYARQCQTYSRLTDHLWIGRQLTAVEARQACTDGVTAVIDLTAEFSESFPFRDLPYQQLAILDLTAPTKFQTDQAVAFIRHHADKGIVYLHCKVGYSRTAAIAGAYLLSIGEVASVEQAITRLRQVRPTLIVRPEALAALLARVIATR